MEFENFQAMRQWFRASVARVWHETPAAIVRALRFCAPVLTLDFWLSLPGKLVAWIWNALGAALTFLRRVFHRLGRHRWVRRSFAGVILFFVASWLILLGVANMRTAQVAPDQPEHTIKYLDQGWGSGGDSPDSPDRQTFYYTPQGTSLLGTGLRYSWFVNLEENGSRTPFVDPDHMRALGFQVDNVPTRNNPDRLPVGFARRFAPEFNDEVLDLTCAACHTGELHVHTPQGDMGIRIDGGQGMHAFASTVPGQFGSSLMAAMSSTLLEPWKFRRFARAVLGSRYPAAAPKLYWDVLSTLGSLLRQGFNNARLNLYPIEEGYGRIDAIGRIANTAFGPLDPSNLAPGNAPVSFPAIWDAHYWDWVQYGASVSQPMARNVGESLGVGASLQLQDDYGRPLLPKERFITSTMIRNLKTIEDTVAKLEPPKWPEDLLGKVDQTKAARGKAIFDQVCAHCHEPCLLPDAVVAVERPLLLVNRKPDSPLIQERKPMWKVNWLPVDEIGTDPQAAINFYQRRVNLEKTGLSREEVMAKESEILSEQYDRKKAAFLKYHATDPANAPDPGDKQAYIQQGLDKAAINLTSASIGAALHFVDTFIRDKSYAEMGISSGHADEQDAVRLEEEYDGEGSQDLPQVVMGYKARPLGGVWATGPYLHNGSVPTLYDLLSPANERPRKFFIRNRMDFDPVRVGLVASPVSDKGFWLDTTIPGNRNSGHEFRAGGIEWPPEGAKPAQAAPLAKPGTEPGQGVIGPEFTPEQRWDIIEYLKIYEEDPKPCKVTYTESKPAQVAQK